MTYISPSRWPGASNAAHGHDWANFVQVSVWRYMYVSCVRVSATCRALPRGHDDAHIHVELDGDDVDEVRWIVARVTLKQPRNALAANCATAGRAAHKLAGIPGPEHLSRNE